MRFQYLTMAAVVAALASLPAFAPTYVVHMAVFVCIYTLPVIGLGYLTGYCGRISLAQGGMFGLGAYTTALLTTGFGLSPLLTFFPAVLVTVVVGTALMGPAMRLAGLYFVMATIGVQQIFWILLMNWVDLTGGPQGVRSIPAIGVGDFTLDRPQQFFFLALAAATLSYLAARRVLASRLGLMLRALSDDELAASTSAVPVSRAKITALALSAAWAGAGGFLYAHYMRFIHPDMFTLEPSILFLVMAMFGGYRSLIGMLVATLVLETATEYLRPLGEFRMIAYGLILLVGMMYFPQGILPVIERWWKSGRALFAVGSPSGRAS